MNIKRYCKKLFNKTKTIYLSKSFAIFIIGLGFIIRLRQYLVNRSLWLDEASLALNIIEKNYLELLQNLDYDQAAPPLFLLITKFLTSVFGNSEYVLRFLPFLSGVLSLYFFYKISQELLDRGAVPLALAFLSFTHYNIYYSVEFKQYSLELLVGLIIIFFGIKLYKSNYDKYYIILYIFIGSLSVWFSHTSVFILSGVGLALILKLYFINDFSKKLKSKIIIYLIFTYFIWIINFLFHYFLIIKGTAGDYLYSFWDDYFLSFPPLSFIEMKKYIELPLKFIINPLGFQYGLALIVFFIIIGEYFIWNRKDKVYFYLYNFPILILLITSMLKIYPFGLRLVLFITPIFYLIIAEGTYGIFRLFSKQNNEFIAILLIFITLFYPLAKGGQNLIFPILKEESRPVINYYLSNRKTEDKLYVYYGAERAFKYYTYGKNISYLSGGEFGEFRNNKVSYLNEIDKLKNKGKVWFLFSHDYNNEKELFLTYLNKKANKVDSFQEKDASIYLYDFYY